MPCIAAAAHARRRRCRRCPRARPQHTSNNAAAAAAAASCLSVYKCGPRDQTLEHVQSISGQAILVHARWPCKPHTKALRPFSSRHQAHAEPIKHVCSYQSACAVADCSNCSWHARCRRRRPPAAAAAAHAALPGAGPSFPPKQLSGVVVAACTHTDPSAARLQPQDSGRGRGAPVCSPPAPWRWRTSPAMLRWHSRPPTWARACAAASLAAWSRASSSFMSR